ncbi:MAG TPA: response regulator transcription factor [Candidatus Dormibacteraeota bacterium]|nr:response regulator transcription factor [Candidatus Dormibacteraeota bacterium]
MIKTSSWAVRPKGREGFLGRGTIAVAGQRRSAIRIGIVDDHPVFRLGLKRALERESDIDITWEMGSAANLDAVMRRTPVDVILMDIFMGKGKDGIAATRELTERWPDVKVAVISASLDTRIGAASTRAGADMFLPKAMPIAEMVSSIRRLVAGSSKRSRTITAPATRSNGSSGRIGGLSPRQRQVLEHLRLGRTNREIASRLGISIGTVNKHVHEVLTALKVRNRTQAAAAARNEAVD